MELKEKYYFPFVVKLPGRYSGFIAAAWCPVCY